MKRITLGVLGTMMAFIATAQIIEVSPYATVEMVGKEDIASTYNGKIKAQPSNGQLAAAGDTIHYSDFNSSSFWTTQNTGAGTGAARGWFIADSNTWWTSQGINSTSGADWATLKPGDPRTGPLSAATFNMTSNAINCTGKGSVILRFQQFYARFEDTASVQISTDNTNWTTVYDNMWLPITSAGNGQNPTTNPMNVRVNISKLAANRSTVYIRFNWVSRQAVQPGIGYVWHIDDVLVEEGSANEVQMLEGYVRDYTNATYTHYVNTYSEMPARQANKYDMTFAAKFENIGGANQTNTQLNMMGSGPNGWSASGASTGFTLNAATEDSTNVGAAAIQLNSGKGDYEIDLFLTSDSALDRSDNDTITFEVEVTDSSYSRVFAEPTTGNNSRYYNPTAIFRYQYGTLFELVEADTMSSVTFWLDGLNARGGSGKLGTVAAYVHSITGFSGDSLLGLPSAPIFSSDTVKVVDLNPQTGGSWVTLPIKRVGGGMDTLNPGSYIVTIEADQFFGADTVFFGYLTGEHNWHNFIRVEQSSGGWTNWSVTDNYYYIKLNTKPAFCPQLNGSASSTATTTCGATDGTATAVDPTNGAGGYTYSWDAPGNPTTKTVTGLSSGIYALTITDTDGCSQVTSATVSDAGAPTITNEQTTDVTCAGRGEGEITFELTAGAAGPGYSYTWFDANGDTVKVGSGATRADSLLQGVEAGSYTVEIVDGGVPPCKQSKTWTVGGPTSAVAVNNVSTDSVSCNGLTDGSATVLASGGTGSLAYAWPGGQTTPAVTGLAAGSYAVSITDDNNCQVVENVNIGEPNALSINTIGPGGQQSKITCNTTGDQTLTADLTARSQGGNGGNTFAWTNSGGDPCNGTGANGEELKVGDGQGPNQLVNDTYTATVTDAKGCSSTRDFDVTCLTVSVEYYGVNFDLKVFPNPNNGSFNINMTNADAGTFSFEVKNMLGQVVFSETTDVSGDYFRTVDLPNAKNGVYFLTISNEEGSASYKIVVE